MVFAVFALIALIWALIKIKSNAARAGCLVLFAIPVIILVLVSIYMGDQP